LSAPLRAIARPFAAAPATGVSIRTRLKDLTPADDRVLREVGEHLGRLASGDLARRVRDGLEHDKDAWASRKRALTAESSARWAGTITKASHDQWGLARRAQWSHICSLRAGVRIIRHRLSLPVGERGSAGQPGGYRSRQEWFQKARRLATLERRLAQAEADYAAGQVSVVRGGKRLLHKRHHLDRAGLTESEWRQQWETARWFLSADGESGKKHGNETIRITPGGEVSLRLPAPLAHLANAPHGRYVLTGRVSYSHRGEEWVDRVSANRAVAYRIHYDVERGRWYLDASWQRKAVPVVPLETLRAGELIGVDMNAGHLAAWRVDTHGNPVGAPRTFTYDLDGPASRRDAQVRHALTRLLHWASASGVKAIAVEDLDFTDSKTREKHGRQRRFRQTICGMPTSKLRARLTSMAIEVGVTVIAVDPAYTSTWGAKHWQAPTTTKTRKTTRHEAAAIAIGRRALGHRIRRRTAPPRHHQSDGDGHRTLQAGPGPARARGTPPPRHRTADTIRASDRDEERGRPGDPTPFGAAHQAGLTPAQCLGTVGRTQAEGAPSQ
jgi:IS605 OrfB family transposase